MTDVLIQNIGRIVSGDLARPFVEGDAIVVRDGKIAEKVDPKLAGLDRLAAAGKSE